MVADMVFQHFGHETVDAASHGCQQHQYICAIVVGGEDAFDGINLSTNPSDARDELLFFLVDVAHGFFDDTLGGYNTAR